MYLKFFASPADLLRLIAKTDRGDHVADNRAGGRELSGSASVEHGGSEHVSDYLDPVKYIGHSVQRIFGIHKDRCNLKIHLSVTVYTRSEELDRRSHAGRIAGIQPGDLCNSLRRDLLVIDFFSGNNCGQDRDLSAGVVAFNIRLRIALRVA